MKIQQKLAVVLTVLLIIPNSLSVLNVKASCEAPMFGVSVEFCPQGYVVMGTFTELSSDISFVQPLASLDGENWQVCECYWDLTWRDTEAAKVPEKFKTQICLQANHEPFKSYLAGELDCFYVKLRFTKDNGITCETQTAVIERGAPQPLPEDITPIAMLDRSILVRHWRPFSEYGKYQLTIGADASAEDIAAFLPDTLPIRVELQRGIDYVAEGIVECPVIWKPLTLPELTAGESVTITDAVEEIIIPEGTMLNTPKGIFWLKESLRIDQFSHSDEVRLVLNVVEENENPTGVLRVEREGLQMAFDLKPTGATVIHAYVFSEGDSGWVELDELSLLEAVNAQPAAANSGYTAVLDNTSKLLQSYLAAEELREEPVPFYVGLKIEGGVYDGRQLVLAWPDTYKAPFGLPNMGGAGGNEGNAGADNKGDGTEEGQRPNLPGSDEQSGNTENKPDTSGSDEQSHNTEKKPDTPGSDEQSHNTEKKPDTPGSDEQSRDTEDEPDTPGSAEQFRDTEDEPDTSGSDEQSRDTEDEPDTSGSAEQQRDSEDRPAVPGSPDQPGDSGDKPDTLFRDKAGAQTAADIDDGKIYPAVPAINPKTDIQILEKDDSVTKMGGTTYVFIVAGIVIAGICVIIIADRKKA